MDDVIGEFLGVDNESTDLVTYEKSNIEINHDHRDKEHDFDESRKTLHSLLLNGEVALEGILRTAVGSGNARDYEVVSTLINSMASISKDLVEIHKQSPVKEESKSVTNNNVYIGSTSELLDLLNNKEKEVS